VEGRDRVVVVDDAAVVVLSWSSSVVSDVGSDDDLSDVDDNTF